MSLGAIVVVLGIGGLALEIAGKGVSKILNIYEKHEKAKLLEKQQSEETKKKMMDNCMNKLAEMIVVVDGKVYRKKNTPKNNEKD